jgi:hypothetical protein
MIVLSPDALADIERLRTFLDQANPGAARRAVAAIRRPAAPQHPGNAEVLVDIRPVNAHRHQFETPAHRGAGVPQPWIPCQRSRDPAAISASVTTSSSAAKATEIGLISPTSISKVLMPFAFEKNTLSSFRGVSKASEPGIPYDWECGFRSRAKRRFRNDEA